MSEPVDILYTNWRGETAVRRVYPQEKERGGSHLWFGSTDWHPEPQWLLHAVDLDKGCARDFALPGIRAWGAEAINAAQLLAADCDVMRKALVVVQCGLLTRDARRVVSAALESKCDAPGFHTAIFTAEKQESMQ